MCVFFYSARLINALSQNRHNENPVHTYFFHESDQAGGLDFSSVHLCIIANTELYIYSPIYISLCNFFMTTYCAIDNSCYLAKNLF